MESTTISTARASDVSRLLKEQKGFDYSLLGPNCRPSQRELHSISVQVSAPLSKALKWRTDAGKQLKQAQDILAKHGCNSLFGDWVSKECGLSRSSAYRCIDLWERFGNCPSLGRFRTEAAHMLARKFVPPKAVKAAMAEAAKGTEITTTKARALIAHFTLESESPANGQPARIGSADNESLPSADNSDAQSGGGQLTELTPRAGKTIKRLRKPKSGEEVITRKMREEASECILFLARYLDRARVFHEADEPLRAVLDVLMRTGVSGPWDKLAPSDVWGWLSDE